MIKKIIISAVSIILLALLIFNIWHLADYSKKNKNYEYWEQLYLSSVEAYEAPLAAYTNENPNLLLLPTKAQAEQVKEAMTFGEIISVLGRPQRHVDAGEYYTHAFQWDLAFNKKLTVTFKESREADLKSWAKRLICQTVTVE